MNEQQASQQPSPPRLKFYEQVLQESDSFLKDLTTNHAELEAAVVVYAWEVPRPESLPVARVNTTTGRTAGVLTLRKLQQQLMQLVTHLDKQIEHAYAQLEIQRQGVATVAPSVTKKKQGEFTHAKSDDSRDTSS